VVDEDLKDDEEVPVDEEEGAVEDSNEMAQW